jgi:hypothetical protein
MAISSHLKVNDEDWVVLLLTTICFRFCNSNCGFHFWGGSFPLHQAYWGLIVKHEVFFQELKENIL